MPSQPSILRSRAALLSYCLLVGWLAGSAGVRGQDASPLPATAPAVAEASAPPAPSATPNPTVAPAATPAAVAQVLYPAKGAANLAAGTQGSTAATANLATTFLVLMGLCAGGYYLLRKQPHLISGFKGGPRKLNVSESRSLGNRQFLVVVEYENERMLLGVTPGRIDYLCPLRITAGSESTVFPEPGGAKP